MKVILKEKQAVSPVDLTHYHMDVKDLLNPKISLPENVIDSGLLQVSPFRLADYAQQFSDDNGEFRRIVGFYRIQRDDSVLMENQKLDPALYEEVVAQIVSL